MAPAVEIDATSPFAANHLEMIMLWPDSEAVRQDLADARAADLIERTAPGLQDLPLGSDGPEMLRWLRSVRPRDDAKNQQRFTEGMVVGRLVVEVVQASRVSIEPVDFAAAKERAVEYLGEFGRRRSLSNFDNITWRALRPAGHLWAAYLVLGCAIGADPFAGRAHVMEMLALAESLLAEGARIQLGPTGHYLLDIERAWRIRPSQ